MNQTISKYSIKVQVATAVIVFIGVVSTTYKFTTAFTMISQKAENIKLIVDKVENLTYRVSELEFEIRTLKNK